MQAYSVSDAGSTDAAAQQASTLVSLAGSPDQLTDDAKTAVLSLALQLASRVDGNDPTAAGNLLSAVGAVSKEAVEGLKAAMASSATLEVRTHTRTTPRAPCTPLHCPARSVESEIRVAVGVLTAREESLATKVPAAVGTL